WCLTLSRTLTPLVNATGVKSAVGGVPYVPGNSCTVGIPGNPNAFGESNTAPARPGPAAIAGIPHAIKQYLFFESGGITHPQGRGTPRPPSAARKKSRPVSRTAFWIIMRSDGLEPSQGCPHKHL